VSTNAWDERAEAYRTSVTHAEGADLDTVVEWCNPHAGVKILDVATGGGHVARRLRAEGAEVVTCDSSPGMQPDVLCRAEDLPFDDGSFDVVVTRIAAHHFENVERAVFELARVSNRVVVVADLLFRTDEEDEAEKLRDPTHVRCYTEEEWTRMLTDVGLEVEQVGQFEKTHDFDSWLARTGCEGADAERVRELLRPVSSEDGQAWTNTVVVLKARKSQR
jgi:ubiquinone/menaquinone biosynthesis C-methylase UbiE